jgi:hypothetical protein
MFIRLIVGETGHQSLVNLDNVSLMAEKNPDIIVVWWNDKSDPTEFKISFDDIKYELMQLKLYK